MVSEYGLKEGTCFEHGGCGLTMCVLIKVSTKLLTVNYYVNIHTYIRILGTCIHAHVFSDIVQWSLLTGVRTEGEDGERGKGTLLTQNSTGEVCVCECVCE